MASLRSVRALSLLSSLTSSRIASRQLFTSTSHGALRHSETNIPFIYEQRCSYAVGRTGRKPNLLIDWGPVQVDGVVGAADFDFVRKNTQDYHFNFPSTAYLECLRKFSRVAKEGGNNWVSLLKEEDRPSAELLHETGCILRELGWVPNGSRWTVAMWTAASEMGFTPSTISLALYLVRSGGFGQAPIFKPAETRFRSLVSSGKDPNALTVEAEQRYRQGMYSAAIRLLTRAQEVGGEDFAWRGSCELFMALSYQKLGKTSLALEHFRAAAQYEIPEAIEGLALLSKDPDESFDNLYAAACRKYSLFSHLAEAELERSADLTDKTAKEEASKWSTEWSNLANPAQKI